MDCINVRWGGISIVIISCWISPSRRARLIHAINVESMKYTTRRPIPPRWRLSVYTYTTHDAGGTQNIHVIYSVSNIIPRVMFC